MAASRAESQHSKYGRMRSNTAQSILRNTGPPLTPLQIGDSKVLNSWVHDPAKDSATVIFNHFYWPGVAEGDILRVTASSDPSSGFLFIVPKDEGCSKPQLQISIPQPIADTFSFRNNGEVTVTKVDKEKCCADYVEFVFQDQYLGRNDMWRLGQFLVGQCVYTDQEVTFIGAIVAKIQDIFIDGKKVSAAHMTSTTKAIYRSLSAKVTIFIQVCRELWEFAGDGERYNEKIVHSFLPALFARWRDAGTNHTVTIVFISRVYYDQSEIDYAAGPLRQDDEGNWYKDFYKVITDLEIIHEWKPTLVSLKDSFWDFQRDILLTHHYHRATLDSGIGPADQVRLVGQLSFAHDGPILEAINLGLNPTEMHYVDRSLSLTGTATIVISPGTGFFRVSKQLLRLTTTRMLDQGFGVDLVLLTKPPLHQSPIFSFKGVEPELRASRDGKLGARTMDPLWGGDDDGEDQREKTTFWWEPFWMSVSFWDKQMDLPFREDRFIARAKMHEIQMLGLLEYDVLSNIEVPYLPEYGDSYFSQTQDRGIEVHSKADADQFDNDIFALKVEPKTATASRNSFASSGSGTVKASSYRSSADKRSVLSHRNSIVYSRITPIEESPRRIIMELPSEGSTQHDHLHVATSVSGLSTSPSQSSIRSVGSTRSGSSSKTLERRLRDPLNSSRGTLTSKFAPAWLFHPFRSGPSEPQTSVVSASASSTTLIGSASSTVAAASSTNTSPSLIASSSPIRMPAPSKPTTMQSTVSRSPQPMTIKPTPSNRSSRAFEDESLFSQRGSFTRRFMNSPSREEPTFGKRRSVNLSSMALPLSSLASPPRPNPSRPQHSASYAESSLARRWQHMFPQLFYKHEIKWKSMVTPGCLPLTVEHFPTAAELESSYDMFSYDFVVDPRDMRSFLVKPCHVVCSSVDEARRAWALAVMKGMAAVRLAQGFQFVLKPHRAAEIEDKAFFRRTKSFVLDDEVTPKPAGASEVLRSTDDPIYLSMSNEIHRISYTGEAIQVRRYVRRMPVAQPFKYQCLIWPKLGGGYTELTTSFTSHGLENYGWNRLDMLVAGYEHQFNESIRYWRTRFVIIPTAEPPKANLGPSGEKLDDEEIRLLGIDKLAEIFTKLRWQPPEEKASGVSPVRFLPTTLDPVCSIFDETLMGQLDEIHAAGPLRKKAKSEREIADMSLSAIAKAMREEDGVPIKNYVWHRSHYPDAFTGFDFVSWLVREFRDVSSRAQGMDRACQLHAQGLFDHCRGQHGFLDGHYFYRLKAQYAIPSTPRRWFSTGRDESSTRAINSTITTPKNSTSSPRKNRKRLILSQSMVIDIDPQKKSDQSENVILHCDILQNPSTVFHFELQWIGTTARCIEDQLRQWNKTIDRYGLKLYEAYVTQISDIRERNPFQSCFPVRLAVPPPVIPDIEKRVPEGKQASHYFESALLRRFGFILDTEADDLFPEHVDVVYSYRRSPVNRAQFVHRSGIAFVQVLSSGDGFLLLTNRLVGPGRMGASLKNKEQGPAAAADLIREELNQFCADKEKLTTFYERELAMLGPIPEEPPPLSI